MLALILEIPRGVNICKDSGTENKILATGWNFVFRKLRIYRKARGNQGQANGISDHLLQSFSREPHVLSTWLNHCTMVLYVKVRRLLAARYACNSVNFYMLLYVFIFLSLSQLRNCRKLFWFMLSTIDVSVVSLLLFMVHFTTQILN